MRELHDGFLMPLLDIVKRDKTLFLSIRNDYINIYYRGGNLLRVERVERKGGQYLAGIDIKYLEDKSLKDTIKTLNGKPLDQELVARWIDVMPRLKHSMDFWFGKHDKSEREFQQLVAYENNVGRVAFKTDYFICDLEYARDHFRVDMVGVRWPSSGPERKNANNLKLVLVEMKYGPNAYTGSAGMVKHVRDADAFLKSDIIVQALKAEMMGLLNQLKELDLVRLGKKIGGFSKDKPEYIFLLANHDPDSKKLKNALAKLPAMANAELVFSVSNFMGYGLFKESIHTKDDFISRFNKQIYCHQ